MIAYASVYGNTENAAEILACRLRDKGICTAMYDVSVSPASDIVAAAFKWSHLVFASTTYNAGIFITMEAVMHDLVAHNIQNRVVAIIENGSWAATSGSLIRSSLAECRDITFIDNMISIKSSVKPEQLSQIEELADSIAMSIRDYAGESGNDATPTDVVDPGTMFKISYGLFVLTVRDGEKDNGCIINTVSQITDNPRRISITVNKANLSCEMLQKTGELNISILTESTPFRIIEQFGFHSGRDTDKFSGHAYDARTVNKVRYLPEYTNAVISAKVDDSYDYGTHVLFVADVTQAFTLSSEPSLTYQYYFDHIKPKPQLPKEHKDGYVCKICGYVYEGASLPDDFICPLCKHGAEDFEKI